MRILVVEDDDRVAAALESALTQRGYQVARAPTGADALAACRSGPPVDLVLLDLGLPDVDGAQLAAELRASSSVPLIVVTARAELVTRVELLRRGADDYVVKPFSTAELLARIEAVLRRTHASAADAAMAVEVGGARIDLIARTVAVDGAPVELTRKEFDVLAALVRADGATVDRQRLLVDVWGTDWLGMSRTLEVHVATLRSKLGATRIIDTVRGVGYRLAVPEPKP